MKMKLFSIFILLASIFSPLQAVNIRTISELLKSENKLFGSSISWNPIKHDSDYRSNVISFSIATAEYEMKFPQLQEKRGEYTFSIADSIVDFCIKNHILLRGTTLAWANEALPSWMLEKPFPRDTLCNILRNYITTVAKHFKGKLYCWDVVNEAMGNGTLNSNIYFEALGESYIDSAFVWTSAADPNVKLFYNEAFGNYNTSYYQTKLKLTYELLSRLKKKGIKIDGIGFQMHIKIEQPIDSIYLNEYLNKFSSLGLEIHFTELDVAIDTPFTKLKLAQQAQKYAEVVRIFSSIPACKSLVVWGFTDKISWIPDYSDNAKGAACLLDEKYQPKPALDSIVAVLGGNIIENESVFPVRSNMQLAGNASKPLFVSSEQSISSPGVFIHFTVPDAKNTSPTFFSNTSNVGLKIFNLQGNLITTIINESKPAGHFSVFWDKKNFTSGPLAPGAYIAQLTVNNSLVAGKQFICK